jgi:flagellar L-ring protein precursor FlgH
VNGLVRAFALSWLGALPLALAGNLYDANHFQSLVADHHAHRAGDVLTVLLVETSTAESVANSSETAQFGLKGSVTDATGPISGGADIAAQSRGEGRTVRSGKLRGQLSVRVERALESGDLVVKGSQLITVNGEQQRISVEGVARPLDIAADNTILSTRLVDARIEYDGEGWVSRSQRPGVFRRLLMFLGF